MALATGLTLASVAAGRASASSRPVPRFVPSRDDLERMTTKLGALRYHWNRATLGKFFAEHCTEQVEVNFYVGLGSDRHGGSWSSPDDIRLFQQQYPKIVSDYSGILSPPSGGDTIYTLAEFERTPPPPPGQDDEILLVSGPGLAGPAAIALQMTFELEDSGETTRIARGSRIVAGLSLRELGWLEQFFED